MSKVVKYLIFSIFILFIQMILAEFVNIYPLIYISILPLIIILLPYRTDSVTSMLIGCSLGLIADIFYDGVIGLNMAAMTATAFFRLPVLNLILSKNVCESLTMVTTRTIETWSFVLYCLIVYAIFTTVYVILDNVLFFSIWNTVLRIVFSTIVNTALALLLERTLVKHIL